MEEEIPYSLQNGLSREEHKWLAERFTESDKLQQEQVRILQEQVRILHRINSTIQIVAVILLVAAILVALQVLVK